MRMKLGGLIFVFSVLFLISFVSADTIYNLTVLYDGESVPLSNVSCLSYAKETIADGLNGTKGLNLTPDQWHASTYKLYCAGFPRRDFRPYNYIEFHVRSPAANPGDRQFWVNTWNVNGNKINISQYIDGGVIDNNWRLVRIPLYRLNTTTWNMNNVEMLLWNMDSQNRIYYVDNIRLLNATFDSGGSNNSNNETNVSSSFLTVEFISPTPANGTTISNADGFSVRVNITNSTTLSNVILEFNDVLGWRNYTMAANGNWNYNLSLLLNRSYQYRVSVIDINGTINFTETRTVKINFVQPWEGPNYWVDHIEDDIIRFWTNYARDEQYGGFYTYLNRSGGVTNTNKSPRMQGRTMYGVSVTYNLTGNDTYREFCREGINFLDQNAWDSVYSGWYNGDLSREGAVIGSTDKWTFSEYWTAKGYLGCYWATGNRSYLDKVETFYNTFESAWNTSVGGYPDDVNRVFVITDDHFTFTSMIDGGVAMVLPLYTLTSNQTYLNRAKQIADLGIANMVDKNRGVVRETFYNNWSYVSGSNQIQTGHNTKFAWYLLYMYNATGNQTYLNAAESVFSNITNLTWDESLGTWYDNYDLSTNSVISTNRDWWPIEDNSMAALLLYKNTGNEKYYYYFKKATSLYLNNFVDETYGEVYQTVDANGVVINDIKGYNFKSMYHSTEYPLFAYNFLNGRLGLPYTANFSFVNGTNETIPGNESEGNVSVTNLTQCGNITVSGNYALINNVSSTGNCFGILVNDVVFDGNGFTVDGDDVYTNSSDLGIATFKVRNITVKNFRVSDFTWGIMFVETNDSLIVNSTAYSAVEGGITLMNRSTRTLIINNTVYGNTHGVTLWLSSTNNDVVNNTAYNNNGGIDALSASGNRITNNLVYSNYVDGLQSSGSNGVGNNFTGNKVTNNPEGLRIVNSQLNVFSDNILNSNTNSISIKYTYISSNNNNFNNLWINGSKGHAILFNAANMQNNNFTNVTVVNTSSGFNDVHFTSAGANGNSFINTYLGRYNLIGAGSRINFADTQFGEVRFASAISGSGQNLSSEVFILFNRAFINSSNSGLSKQANISLYNLPSFTDPVIYNGTSICSGCVNFTSLNAGNVRFRVPQGGDYSVGER